MLESLKRAVIGSPIASSEEHHHRLRKIVALPVFASDAISSTAYATEEILLVLLVLANAGTNAYHFLVPISLVVVALLVVVASSYRQTIYAYPTGGGSYIVSKDNLGVYPSLVAGGSVLTDYILTVAVSVAGGVAAIISAFNSLAPYRVELCVAAVILMTLANLRGMKESGALFAPPTYIYIASIVLLIVVGLVRVFFFDLGPIVHTGEEIKLVDHTGPVAMFFFLKAFSSGAVALTGVEAVSDGVPAFRRPESKNASSTLIAMAAILGTCFFGLSVLAAHLHPVKSDEIPDTVLAQLAQHVYGGRNLIFYITQFATFAILILAANTAYADYPRLSSIIARDGYLPRQFANRGDRLVFSNGVLFLSVVASVLIVAFGGEVSNLIPLYAVGVFTGFTLSQTGMVVRHWRLREKNWRFHSVINGIGAVTTAIVALVVVTTKFSDGAWIPAALIPILVMMFKMIHRHYERVRTAVEIPDGYRARRHTHNVVVLIGTVNKGALNALEYARSLSPDRLIAVSVVGDPAEQEALDKAWAERKIPIELHTIYSPYRELTRPVLNFLDELDRQDPDDIITVVIPEFVTGWATQFLHNQSAFMLKARLLYRPNTVVTSVPVLVDPKLSTPAE
jgi:amino acid transporter